jgi:hypothetical protein
VTSGQDSGDGRAARLKPAGAECSLNVRPRLVGSEVLVGDGLVELGRAPNLDVSAPLLVDVAGRRHAVDERLDEVLLVAKRRRRIDRSADLGAELLVIAVTELGVPDRRRLFWRSR